jgi:hypothetical protein
MNDWAKDLEKKYIHLFETDKNNVPLRGIEVEKGWKRIVESLLEKFEWIRTHNTYITNPNFDETKEHSKDNSRCIKGPDHIIKIFQIKQKLGCFECYTTVSNDEKEIAYNQVDNAIAYAQGQAMLTCEFCGRIGNVDGTELSPTTKGWIRILCNKCRNK